LDFETSDLVVSGFRHHPSARGYEKANTTGGLWRREYHRGPEAGDMREASEKAIREFVDRYLIYT
jgi:hypothetical protein